MTNRMPRRGRLVLTPMLNERGKLIGDFTIAHGSAKTGSCSGDRARRRSIIFAGSRSICRTTLRHPPLRHAWSACRSLVRNRAALLQRLTDEDVSAGAFKFMDHRAMEVANLRHW